MPNFTYAGGLSPAIMFHSDDDISLFVPFFDIAVSLGDLFQRIAPIYDRFYLPRLNQLCEEDKIFDLLTVPASNPQPQTLPFCCRSLQAITLEASLPA